MPVMWLAACMGLWLLTLALWWNAAGVAGRPPDAWALVLALGAGWMVYCVWLLQRMPAGTLNWCVDHPQEPGYWAWQDEMNHRTRARPALQQLSGLEWALDLQWAVLLRVQFTGDAPRWVWCLQAHAPARWGALRRSLQYTRQLPPAM